MTQWDLGALQTALPWKRGGGERERKSVCMRERERKRKRASEARGLEKKGMGSLQSSQASCVLSRVCVWTEGVGRQRKAVGEASTYWAAGG